MTQSPLRPPTMKAAFRTPGQTATASALSRRSRGISLSGTDIALRTTSAAERECREASADLFPAPAPPFFCADAGKAMHATANAASANTAHRLNKLISIHSLTPLMTTARTRKYKGGKFRARFCPPASAAANRPAPSRFETSEAQAVRNDRDGGERHRRAREDGVERPPREGVEESGRERDAERVVCEGPE